MMRWHAVRGAAALAAGAFLVTLGLVMPAAAETPGTKSTPAAKQQEKLPEGQTRVMIPVEGMTCAGCSASITLALKRLDGVIRVDVDFRKGAATVVHEKDKVTVKQMVATINKAGFKARMPEKG